MQLFSNKLILIREWYWYNLIDCSYEPCARADPIDLAFVFVEIVMFYPFYIEYLMLSTYM